MADGPKIVPIKPLEPVQELVAYVAELAENVESGEITALAIVRVFKDGSTCCGWAWDVDVDSARLIGGAATLQHRLIHELDTGGDG